MHPVDRAMCKNTLLTRACRGLEVGGKVAWVPILIVSSFGLYYNCGNYDIQSRSDRADVKTTNIELYVIGGVINWLTEYENLGRRDAKNFKFILGIIDPRMKDAKPVAPPFQAAVLESGVPHKWSFIVNNKEVESDILTAGKDVPDIFVTCFIYDDGREHRSQASFYHVPPERRNPLAVTYEENQALSSGFSCVQIEK
jgi:hypothetical protein